MSLVGSTGALGAGSASASGSASGSGSASDSGSGAGVACERVEARRLDGVAFASEARPLVLAGAVLGVALVGGLETGVAGSAVAAASEIRRLAADSFRVRGGSVRFSTITSG